MTEKTPQMTKREVMALLGFRYEADLARLYGITKAAVHHWGGLDEPIPRGRYLELRYEIHPELFEAPRKCSSGSGDESNSPAIRDSK